jgi:hypothetical protein
VYANDSSVTGNIIDGNGNTNISNGIIAVNCANVHISANKVSNIPNGYGIVLNTSTNCMVTGNYTSNITAADYRSVSTCTGSRISENVSDTSPTISLGSDVTTANNSWQSVSYASAEPTTGTYIRGAIVYNNTPSSAGYVGWVCTSSGTPGTWKTFGLIS